MGHFLGNKCWKFKYQSRQNLRYVMRKKVRKSNTVKVSFSNCVPRAPRAPPQLSQVPWSKFIMFFIYFSHSKRASVMRTAIFFKSKYRTFAKITIKTCKIICRFDTSQMGCLLHGSKNKNSASHALSSSNIHNISGTNFKRTPGCMFFFLSMFFSV